MITKTKILSAMFLPAKAGVYYLSVLTNHNLLLAIIRAFKRGKFSISVWGRNIAAI